MNSLLEDQHFKQLNAATFPLQKGEYDCCTFTECSLANTDLSDFVFTECVFERCDLSMVKMNNTALKDVQFIGCKLLGVLFETCKPFLLEFSFEDCQLNLASFQQLKIPKTTFQKCLLQETDFTETNLTSSHFHNCDLSRAVFESTNLEQVDFLTSHNYTIDPERNRMKQARFSRDQLFGLLSKYNLRIE